MTEKKKGVGVDVDHLIKEALTPSEREIKEQEIRDLRRRLRLARKDAAYYNRKLEFMTKLGTPVSHKIKARAGTKKTGATAVLVASDWHVEEVVEPKAVSGLNKYNPDIAKKRADTMFSVGRRLTDLVARDLEIDTIVLALLGDFITNELHEDSAENNAMPPMEAAFFAQELLSSGINHLLESGRKVRVVCHSGNHGRVTRRVHHAKEEGHSIEYMVYCNLAKSYESVDNAEFDVASGYHGFTEVMGKDVRTHHGHRITYHGGVGGITIPVNKAIAQWDKARHADLDLFGHFHQYIDGGKWFCNGSLIGYNPYAVSIKAEYEPPRQGFLVIDNKRGRTYTAPIYVEE
jgi:hypothetical protein